MQKLKIASICLAMISATAAEAASDTGLSVPSFNRAPAYNGFGAQLGATFKLDGGHSARGNDRLRIGVTAGPMLTIADAKTGFVRRGIGNIAGITLRPGRSISLNIAGQPLVAYDTEVGTAKAARDDAGTPDTKRRKGISTLGWIAIGVGAATLAAFLVGREQFAD